MVKINKSPLFARLVLFFLLTVFAVSNLIPASIASADGQGGSAISSQLSGQVLDHQLYYFLVSCAAQADVDETKDDEVESWEWFKNGSYTKVATRGDMYQNPQVSCEEGKYISEAFGRFGFTEPWSTICQLDFMYDEQTGGLGKTVNGGNTSAACELGKGKDGDIQGAGDKSVQRSGMEKLLKTTAAGRTAATQLIPEAEYLRKYRTLMNGCQITLTEKITKNSDKATGEPQLFKIPIVNQNGSVEWWLGKAPWNDADSRKMRLVATTSSNGTENTTFKTCGQLSKDLQGTAANNYRDGLFNSYATYIERHKDDTYSEDTPKDGSEDEEGTTSCAIDGIGWLICPVVNFAASITDASYTAVAAMLTVQPLTTQADGPYSAWEAVRNVANIAFVVAFLIVIYSQMTGAGIGNYGIKRMLPRLIIAAILVNVSYWICAIAVDLSNILGTSIKAFLDTANSNLPVPSEGLWDGGNSWTNLAGAVLIGGIALAVGLSAFLPLLITALFAIVVTFLILTLRQGLLILLIVIAPLAFVAYLLPNTESWFKRWMSLLQVLLLMFPLISLIFGASAIAGTIIMQSAEGQDNDGLKIALQSMGAGVTIIPLFILPIVMKTAGGLLGKIGATINNPNKGPFDRMKKGAQSYRQDRQNLRNRRAIEGKGMPGRGRFVRWRARKSAVSTGREADLKRATTGYVADQAESNDKFRNALAGGTALQTADNASVARVLASAKAANTKQLMEEIDNLVATVDLDIKSNIPELKNRFDKAVQEGNVAHQAAYLKMMNANGSPGIEAMEESLSKRTRGTPYNDKDLMDLKDIMSGDSNFRAAGRSFEVWANNERSEDAVDANGNVIRDSEGNKVKVPHANFEAVNNDPSVYKDISAQRFAGMSKPQQDKALTVLEQADTANGTKLAEALAKRVAADTTAMGSIKGVPQERIRAIIDSADNPPS